MNIEQIKEDYPVGTKIELLDMDGETRMYPGLKGEVTGVDDIGQIHMKWENGSSLALNLETDTFRKVEESEKIKVLLIKPNQYPKVVEIEDSLESMQKIVGGYIEEYMPFEDDVAVICNEEGKIRGLPLNRAIYENDEMIDIIAGDFFIANAPPESENFLSLTDKMIDKYKEKFKYPEKFYQTEKGIESVKFKPMDKEKER